MRDKDSLRIAIIGAGAAGLSAAEALKDKGYKNIVIFEKRDRAGGQVYTYDYKTPDDRRILCELGSIQPVAAGSGALGLLIKRYGLTFGRVIAERSPEKFKVYSANKKGLVRDFVGSPIGFPFTFRNCILLAMDIAKLSWYLWRYRALSRPSYAELSKPHLQELARSKEQWVDDRRFYLISDDLKYFLGGVLTLMNAGRTTVSAAAFFKLLLYCLKPPIRYANGTYVAMREGYQELWNRVAAQHDVRYNSQVTRVLRTDKAIIVENEHGTHECDRIIMTCASFEFERFLETTKEETEVFSKVQYSSGWRAAFSAKHLPHDAIYVIYETCVDATCLPGIATLIPEGQIDGETWLYSCIIAASDAGPIEPVLRSIEEFLHDHFGGENIQWLKFVYWPQYSPYFPYQDVKSGLYERLEELQGKHGTYYGGDVVATCSNAIVADYSYQLADRFF